MPVHSHRLCQISENISRFCLKFENILCPIFILFLQIVIVRPVCRDILRLTPEALCWSQTSALEIRSGRPRPVLVSSCPYALISTDRLQSVCGRGMAFRQKDLTIGPFSHQKGREARVLNPGSWSLLHKPLGLWHRPSPGGFLFLLIGHRCLLQTILRCPLSSTSMGFAPLT